MRPRSKEIYFSKFFEVNKYLIHMDEKIFINDLSVVTEYLVDIRSAIVLLDIFKQKADALNQVFLSKKLLAKLLNVSSHTVSNWLRKLSKAGAIRYKNTEIIIVNPFLYFYGTEEDFIKAKQEYENCLM